jgi:kumamolisin
MRTRATTEPAQNNSRTPLHGWQYSHLKGAKLTPGFDPQLPMEVTVILRAAKRMPAQPPCLGTGYTKKTKKHLSHQELADRHGPSPKDIAAVRSFAEAHQLSIMEDLSHGRMLVLRGAAESIARAFDLEFAMFRKARATYFAPTHDPSIPRELKNIVRAVLGLHSRPSARRQRHWSRSRQSISRSVADLAEIYAFPGNTDGNGQTIGLIELGGGFNPDDIAEYCSRLGVPTPRITTVNVRGGANRPAPPEDIRKLLECVNGKRKLSAAELASDAMEAAQATVETTMDIEIVAALAPGAHIVVYFATPDEQGIYNALNRAVHDAEHRPDVISISWGEPEIGLSDAYIHAIDHSLAEAAHLGITVFASAGDAGALNNSPDNLPAVNFPASSPHCIACGGTTPKRSRSKAIEEIVWNSSHYGLRGMTGGGVSRKFPVPHWQRDAGVPLGPTGKQGRGVPDLAGPADPRYGSEILIAGSTCSSAGTSAVAPLWAALIARCNQALGRRCGHLNPLLYELGRNRTPVLRPVTKGHNDFYSATAGWNPCAGHGVLHGDHLLSYLQTLFPRKRKKTTRAV